MKATLKRLITTFLLAVMTTGSAQAACVPEGCLAPCNYEELLVDTGFQNNCPDWQWTGSSQRIQSGNDYEAELYGSGTVSQSIGTSTFSGMTIEFDLTMVKNNPGTERLVVEIIRYTTIVETAAVIYPSSNQTHFVLPIGNYSNDWINIRFRWKPGTAPGDTKFRIDNACLFADR